MNSVIQLRTPPPPGFHLILLSDYKKNQSHAKPTHDLQNTLTRNPHLFPRCFENGGKDVIGILFCCILEICSQGCN